MSLQLLKLGINPVLDLSNLNVATSYCDIIYVPKSNFKSTFDTVCTLRT